MDREKVIKGLECCSDVGGKHCYEGKCPYASMSEPCREQLASDALALLKEQEEVEPYITGNGESFEEPTETWWYECGNCNKPIDLNDKYCRYCGKAVKWK